MQKLYVVTIKQGRYSSQTIGATTDTSKISNIISDYADSIRDGLSKADADGLDYLLNSDWHYVEGAAVGAVRLAGIKSFSVEIAITNLY